MTVYHYEEVRAYGRKTGHCEVCGKSATRSQVFTNTINPFNRNEDGSVRTRAEVQQRVLALVREWEQGPIRHARCES